MPADINKACWSTDGYGAAISGHCYATAPYATALVNRTYTDQNGNMAHAYDPILDGRAAGIDTQRGIVNAMLQNLIVTERNIKRQNSQARFRSYGAMRHINYEGLSPEIYPIGGATEPWQFQLNEAIGPAMLIPETGDLIYKFVEMQARVQVDIACAFDFAGGNFGFLQRATEVQPNDHKYLAFNQFLYEVDNAIPHTAYNADAAYTLATTGEWPA